MLKFLTKGDLFGVEEKLQINSQNPKQKSEFGGIMTLILYGISFAYFLSEFIDWSKNNKVPKISTFKGVVEPGETITFPGRFLEIESGQYSDAFKPNAMILIPEVSICREIGFCQEFQMHYESIDKGNGYFTNRYFLENDQIIASQNNLPESIYYEILLNECIASKYSQNNTQFTCAEQSEIDNYVNAQDNSIKLKFNTTEFNTHLKEFYQISHTVEKTISSYIKQLYLLSWKINDLQIDDGILFSQLNKFSIIQDYLVETKGIFYERDEDKLSPHKGEHLTIKIRLDEIKSVTYIEYSKLSEILADTGAIITWILQISFLVSRYNEKLCQENTINEIIKMYFPDFANLTLKKNIRGEIISAQIKEKNYDPQKIKGLINRITLIAHSKVSFINLQYEISRLQFLITKQLGVPCVKSYSNPENKIENFLDTFDYRIKSNQPDSIINISQEQPMNVNQTENMQLENAEDEQLEQIIGLIHFKPDQQFLQDQEQSKKIEKNIELSIIPKECLKQEDLSGLNSPK